MFFSWAMNSVNPERAMNKNAMKITNFVIHGLFSMPLTDHEKQTPIFHDVFMCICVQTYEFSWGMKIEILRGFYNGFFNGFFMFFAGQYLP